MVAEGIGTAGGSNGGRRYRNPPVGLALDPPGFEPGASTMPR